MGSRRDSTHDSRPGRREKLTPEAFVALYRDAYPRLYLIAAGIVGDRTQAEDIVQESAIIALEKLDQFETGSSFGAWLAEIVRRCSLNYARKLRKRKTIVSDPHLLEETREVHDTPPSAWPINDQTGSLASDQSHFDDELLRALNGISPEARCCLLLRVVQNLSYAEISELLQIPEGTAMSHVHRSKRTLRRAIERERDPAAGTSSDKK
jgi:RNA polymerase sigma-70 factor (ECF subfamily)